MSKDYEIAEERLLALDDSGEVIELVKEGDKLFWAEGPKDENASEETKVFNITFKADIAGDRIIKEMRSDFLFSDLYTSPTRAMAAYSKKLHEYNEKKSAKS